MVTTTNCDSYKVKMILESSDKCQWHYSDELNLTMNALSSLITTRVCSSPCGMHHIRLHKLYSILQTTTATTNWFKGCLNTRHDNCRNIM